ncbi:MAG: TonB-dependent receptor [Pseudoxanthomonas suwonensis]|nr:TonB-dependent receptor [Pseudoxanthomonas suwonensis]
MPRRKRTAAIAGCFGCAALAPLPLAAQDMPRQLDAIIVKAAPLSNAPERQPGAVSVVVGERVRAENPGFSLSEVLRGVPGLSVRDRHNAAQDLQMSIRGAGARSPFGMRGMQVIIDGIPATMPDGQSQVSHLDIGTLHHVEVLRGPLATLRGNGSQGVLLAETERGQAPSTLRLGATFNEERDWRWGLGGSMAEGRWDLRAGIGRQRGHGFREHSASDKSQGNLRWGWQTDAAGRIDVVLNSLAQFALDPQGLTRTEFEHAPWLAAPSAKAFNTRKRVRQDQAGLRWQRELSARNSVTLAIHHGSRQVTQFQSIPVAVQQAPGHGGGVIDLDRRYGGMEANWVHATPGDIRGVVALSRQQMQERRQGFENFLPGTGEPVLGTRGRLRRDEDTRLLSTDAYVQVQWPLGEAFSLDTGARHSRIDMEIHDDFLANGDDSGTLRFQRTLPVAALHWHPLDGRGLHLAWGRGFETPTMNELAYGPDGSGPNRQLRPALSSQWELGGQYAAGASRLSFALFDIRTRDEIVVASSSGGRTTYRNAARTQRRGLEAGWVWQHADWQADAAWTLLDARMDDGATGELRLPGTARHWGSLSLRRALGNGFHVGLGLDASSALETGGTERAPGAVSWHLSGRRTWQAGRSRINAFARIDNLFDRRYAGSVIVGQAQQRYYEPAPGRTLSIGFEMDIGASNE